MKYSNVTSKSLWPCCECVFTTILPTCYVLCVTSNRMHFRTIPFHSFLTFSFLGGTAVVDERVHLRVVAHLRLFSFCFVLDRIIKVRKIRNDFIKPTFLPKNEKTNLSLLLVDFFLFVFWKKVKTPKRHLKINRPLVIFERSV